MHAWLLVGNYGVGNLGDEALKEYFLDTFPEIDWKVLSANPGVGEYARFPGGIRSFLGFGWVKTLKALRQSEGMVFGGGSLFTDAESSYACFLWWIHVLFARLCGKKVVLAFQGIGPFHPSAARMFARKAVRAAHHISVRDVLSYERVQSFGMSTKVVQTFDPVFSLIHKQKTDGSTQKILIVIPRFNSGESFQKMLQDLLQKQVWEGVTILSMQPGDHREQKYCLEVAESLGNLARYVETLTVSSLVQEVSKGSAVLTERFHGGIVALALEKELHVVSQKEGDKLSTLRSLDISELQDRIRVGEVALRSALQN